MSPIGPENVANAFEFIQMSLKEQRALISSKESEKKKLLEQYIKSIFVIIGNVFSDRKLVKYFILLIDGIIEGNLPFIFPLDDRERTATFVNFEKLRRVKIIDTLKQ